MEDTEKVRGNPVVREPDIPPAPVPSLVRMSMVPPPPPPIPKEVDGEEVAVTPPGDSEGKEDIVETAIPKTEEEIDAKPKGVITIKVFEYSPYEVDFEGVITGSEVDIAWKAMMKGYRGWKHTLFKKETEGNGGV